MLLFQILKLINIGSIKIYIFIKKLKIKKVIK